MIIIRNTLLPLKGWKAMCVFPFIFVRKEAIFTNTDLNHEMIHAQQQVELMWVGFFIAYAIEYLIGLACFGDKKMAYRYSSFEMEAYEHEKDLQYLEDRRPFAQWRIW